jgi:DNA-binding NtrC family response regulator
MKVLMSLPWKGNIRDLNNVLERAMILGNGEWITVKDLPNWEVPEEIFTAASATICDAPCAPMKKAISKMS